MKYTEVKELSIEEIKTRIAEEKINYTKLKFSHALSAIENPLKMKALRKDIARLNTELNVRLRNA